ncbi:hypothetical protein BJ912DRAFT_534333 [Pholiota molesta]|nr:hypothetical protein BJ912DRAFT_534333 [Pholiota molesta]
MRTRTPEQSQQRNNDAGIWDGPRTAWLGRQRLDSQGFGGREQWCAASAIGQASRQRREFEIRVTNAALAVEEETDKLPDAERRRRRGRSAKAGASVRAAPIRPCRNSPVSGLQSTCADVVRHTDATSAGWPLVLAHGRTTMRTAQRRGGEDDPSVPLTNKVDDNRRMADGMDARTPSLLPRSIAPRLAVPVAQGHGPGVSLTIGDGERSCGCYERRWASKLEGYLGREDDISAVRMPC